MSLLADDPTTHAGGLAHRVRVVPLGEQHRAALTRLVARDPLVNVVADARLQVARRFTTRELGGAVLGAFDAAGELTGAVLDAGAVQPVGGGPVEWAALGRHLARSPRACGSIVGRVDAVAGLWAALEHRWGRPRAVRERQPLLSLTSAEALPAGHPGLRPVRLAELDAYLPAAAAMFTEELGASPTRGAGGVREYRARVAGLIAARRCFGVLDRDGAVVFKADFGCVTPATVQVQGVWTHPSLRGQGLAGQAMASVLRAALRLAPSVSLYVNDYNEPARRLYHGLGMRQVDTLRTVLF